MKIEDVEFHFKNNDKIYYDCKTDTFTYVGKLANAVLNLFIAKQMEDTIERLIFIKNIPLPKSIIKNVNSKVYNKIERKYNMNNELTLISFL